MYICVEGCVCVFVRVCSCVRLFLGSLTEELEETKHTQVYEVICIEVHMCVCAGKCVCMCVCVSLCACVCVCCLCFCFACVLVFLCVSLYVQKEREIVCINTERYIRKMMSMHTHTDSLYLPLFFLLSLSLAFSLSLFLSFSLSFFLSLSLSFSLSLFLSLCLCD